MSFTCLNLIDFIPSLKGKKEQLIEEAKDKAINRFLNQDEKFLEEETEMENNITKCLNKKAYLAVTEDKFSFRNQTDCRLCWYYIIPLSRCAVGLHIKRVIGFCPVYECKISIQQKRK